MPNLSQYEPIAEAIARLFHPHVEVVLHDILENRIVAIFNSFSRRKSGDNSLIEDVQSLAAIASVQGPFEKWGEDGRRIRYVSSVLRDDRGETVGLMCVNFDTSSLASIQTSIETFLGSTADSSELDRLFNDDWQVRIGAYVSTFLQERNQSLGRRFVDCRLTESSLCPLKITESLTTEQLEFGDLDVLVAIS